MKKMNLALVVSVLLVLGLPALVKDRKNLSQRQLQGTDDAAVTVIEQFAPRYKPWAKPCALLHSGTIEGLLFALQASIGAGLVAYYFGYQQGRRVKRTIDHAARH